MSESDANRRNPHTGADCPPWCTIDHSRPGMTSCVGGGSTGMDLGPVWARAVLSLGAPLVAVDGCHPDDATRSAYVSVESWRAENLATFVELLADVPPADVRELAAAIRKAAADIEGARRIVEGGQA